MKKPNPLFEKRRYFPVEEAAVLLSVSVSDVVHFAAQDELPMYTIADRWHGRAYTEDEGGNWSCVSPSDSQVSGLVRIRSKDVQRYEGNSQARVSTFLAGPDSESDEEASAEFRLTGEPIPLAECKLVVLASDIQSLAGKAASGDAPLTTKERTSLLRILAALAKEAGFDLSHATKSSEALAKLTQSGGYPVSAKTIEKYFKEARESVLTGCPELPSNSGSEQQQ